MISSIWIALGLVALLFGALERRRRRWPHAAPPAFMGRWPGVVRVAVLVRQLDHFYDFLRAQAARFGHVFSIHVPLYGAVFVLVRPDDAQHVLVHNFDNYVKGPVVHDCLRVLLGDGIFTTDGAAWKKQRQSAAHLFKKRLMNEAIRVMLAHGRDVADYLATAADGARAFDAQQLFSAFTMDSFVEVAFGRKTSSLRARMPFADAFDAATRQLVIRLVFPFWRWIPVTPGLDKHISVVRDYADGIIKERKAELESNASALDAREDILSRFMALGEKDVVALRDAVINFILAGRDTTAQTLTWLTYFLAQHPDIQEQVRAEICEHVVDGEPLTLDVLKKLTLTQAAIDETLRLRPPVPIDIKQALHDDLLPSGVHVPAGTLVMWTAYVMGHSEELWTDPMRFNPHRWLDPDRPVPATRSIPFQAGPRICLGMTFAYTEVKTCLTALLPHFRFDVAKEHPEPVIASGITISARDGVMLRVSKLAK